MNYFRFFKISASIISCIISTTQSSAQTDSLNNTASLKRIIIIESATVTLTYASFYQLWYAQNQTSSFHLFDDRLEWQGIDKLGHSFGGYWLSSVNTNLLRRTSLNNKKACIIGSTSAFIFMSSIEILDGFSEAWGASIWDIAANASGTTLYATQQLLWNKQKIYLKYSFFPSEYSKYRPNLLGTNIQEQIIKDYNAIDFWLSANIWELFNTNKVPKWCNIAIGYSADGMTGGHENLNLNNSINISNQERKHSIYLSFDIDLTKIDTKSKTIRNILYALNTIKVPAPTLIINETEINLGFR